MFTKLDRNCFQPICTYKIDVVRVPQRSYKHTGHIAAVRHVSTKTATTAADSAQLHHHLWPPCTTCHLRRVNGNLQVYVAFGLCSPSPQAIYIALERLLSSVDCSSAISVKFRYVKLSTVSHRWHDLGLLRWFFHDERLLWMRQRLTKYSQCSALDVREFGYCFVFQKSTSRDHSNPECGRS